jgi:hypothetical protein
MIPPLWAPTIEIAWLVAQAIDDGAPEVPAEIGSAKGHAVDEASERFQLVPRRGR